MIKNNQLSCVLHPKEKYSKALQYKKEEIDEFLIYY